MFVYPYNDVLPFDPHPSNSCKLNVNGSLLHQSLNKLRKILVLNYLIIQDT